MQSIVTTWNRSAERIFGYTAKEMIGQPILRLIPDERKEEEPAILARLRVGERVDHFDAKRRHKDGHQLEATFSDGGATICVVLLSHETSSISLLHCFTEKS